MQKKPQQKKERNLDPFLETDSGHLYRCDYCESIFDKKNITKDHKHPKALGGKNDKKNYVPSCQPCNTLKADIPYEKFKAIIEEFGLDIIRLETPEGSTNHTILEGGMSYHLWSGKPKAIVNVEIGYGSRILTTVIVKDKLYVFVSKKYGKEEKK